MVSAEEQKYLYWLGSRIWSGQGDVVEIGPWLGGSTICLAAGMQASDHNPAGRLRTVDAFEWSTEMERWIPPPVRAGESFYELFRRNVAEFKEIVQSEAIKLPSDGSQQGADEATAILRLREACPNPIEILFVDGAKSWRGMRCLLRAYRDRLLPSVSYIVCQDYKHWTYWVPIMIEHLASALQPAHDVMSGGTVAFRVIGEISREPVEAIAESLTQVPVKAALEAISSSSQRLVREGDVLGAAKVRLGAVRFLSGRAELAMAAEEFLHVQAEWPTALDVHLLERMREELARDYGMQIDRPLRLQAAYWSWRVRRSARASKAKLAWR